jgi:hypothetical protein
MANYMDFLYHIDDFLKDSNECDKEYELVVILAAGQEYINYDILWLINIILPINIDRDVFFQAFSLFCGMGFFKYKAEDGHEISKFIDTDSFVNGVLEREAKTFYFQKMENLIMGLHESFSPKIT